MRSAEFADKPPLRWRNRRTKQRRTVHADSVVDERQGSFCGIGDNVNPTLEMRFIRYGNRAPFRQVTSNTVPGRGPWVVECARDAPAGNSVPPNGAVLCT